MLAIETGLWVQYEIIDGELILNGPSRSIAKGIRKRKPIEDYLSRQGRFAHFTPEDIAYFQQRVDDSWGKMVDAWCNSLHHERRLATALKPDWAFTCQLRGGRPKTCPFSCLRATTSELSERYTSYLVKFGEDMYHCN